MGMGTVDRCREDGRGEKADRSGAVISKPIYLRYCQEQIHAPSVTKKVLCGGDESDG